VVTTAAGPNKEKLQETKPTRNTTGHSAGDLSYLGAILAFGASWLLCGVYLGTTIGVSVFCLPPRILEWCRLMGTKKIA
jgi:hypothetical protein